MKTAKILSTAILMFLFIFSFAYINAQDTNNDAIKIFNDKKCVSCHSISVLNIEKKNKNSKAPDISGIGNKYDAPFLMNFLQKKAEINGKKHGLRFNGTDEELTTLVDFLVTLQSKEKQEKL